jgi:hypothetical protein
MKIKNRLFLFKIKSLNFSQINQINKKIYVIVKLKDDLLAVPKYLIKIEDQVEIIAS